MGYKLQVTETEDEELPHLITDIAVTDATVPDIVALSDIQQRQQQNGTLPGERYVDSGMLAATPLRPVRCLRKT